MRAPRRSNPTLGALTALAASACVGPAPAGHEATSQPVRAEMLEIDFSARPSYLDPNVIVLTFDDGPDGTYTPMVLDILRDKGVKATFFINTNNQTMVASDGVAQALLRRMLDEGHELATHTVHHLDLAELPAERIEEEIAGVEETVRAVLGESGPPLTLLRAPFGRPYQSAAGSAAYQKVASVVARHAVHIGWAIDSNDWRYAGDADRVFNHVTGLVKQPGQGAYGIVLLHSINPQTVAALPRLIDYMREAGFVFKLTEDVVRARFGGLSSAELLRAPPRPPAGGSGASGASGGVGGGAGTGGGSAFDGGPTVDARAGSAGSGGGGSSSGRSGSALGGAGPQEQPAGNQTVTGGCSTGGPPRGGSPLVLALAFVTLALRRIRRYR